MLTDEVIANVIENGHSIGPKRCVAGEIVEVYEGAGELLIAHNRAVQVKEKAVTKELEEVEPEVKPEVKVKKTKKSKTPKPESENIWHTDSEPLSKKQKK